MPGGDLNYSMRYDNNGNVPLQDVFFTATLPADTSLAGIWHYDRNWNSLGQITPTSQSAAQVVWDIGDLPNGAEGNLRVTLHVDPSATPGALLTHRVEIAPDPAEYHYDDNAVIWTEPLNAPGPNLQVNKQNRSWWDVDRLSYEIRIKNIFKNYATQDETLFRAARKPMQGPNSATGQMQLPYGRLFCG